MKMTKILSKPNIIALGVGGIVVRIIFSFYFSKYWYGEIKFSFGDTPTYINSFLNLLNLNTFCFDLNNLDSCFYRGPIYTIFYGIHYILIGDQYAQQLLAVTQCVLDVVTGYLILLIVYNHTHSSKWSICAFILYLFNPFAIINVPITG